MSITVAGQLRPCTVFPFTRENGTRIRKFLFDCVQIIPLAELYVKARTYRGGINQKDISIECPSLKNRDGHEIGSKCPEVNGF
jgi:hypothetical protein